MRVKFGTAHWSPGASHGARHPTPRRPCVENPLSGNALPMMLTDKFLDGAAFAQRHHPDTAKGSSIPVMAHLIGVASLVLEDGGDEDLAIAALLHDVAEDAGGAAKLQEIQERYGERVARIVEGCSDSLVVDPDAKEDWWIRKRRYLAHLRETTDEDVLRVSVADKTYNLLRVARDEQLLDAENWERFKTGRDGQHWYFNELLDIYAEHGVESALLPLLQATFKVVFGGARLPTIG